MNMWTCTWEGVEGKGVCSMAEGFLGSVSSGSENEGD